MVREGRGARERVRSPFPGQIPHSQSCRTSVLQECASLSPVGATVLCLFSLVSSYGCRSFRRAGLDARAQSHTLRIAPPHPHFITGAHPGPPGQGSHSQIV